MNSTPKHDCAKRQIRSGFHAAHLFPRNCPLSYWQIQSNLCRYRRHISVVRWWKITAIKESKRQIYTTKPIPSNDKQSTRMLYHADEGSIKSNENDDNERTDDDVVRQNWVIVLVWVYEIFAFGHKSHRTRLVQWWYQIQQLRSERQHRKSSETAYKHVDSVDQVELASVVRELVQYLKLVVVFFEEEPVWLYFVEDKPDLYERRCVILVSAYGRFSGTFNIGVPCLYFK